MTLIPNGSGRGAMLRILTYHRVADIGTCPRLNQRLVSATPVEFEKQMRHLARSYRVVSATEVLEGRAETLEPYETAVRRALGRLVSASWGAKHAFDRFPRLAFALSKPSVVWPVVEGLLRGDISHPGAAGGLARGPLKVVQGLSRLAGSQDARYRIEGAG